MTGADVSPALSCRPTGAGPWWQLLITRNLLAHYRGSEIHNEILHDESAAFAVDRKYPESDLAPVVATFDLPT